MTGYRTAIKALFSVPSHACDRRTFKPSDCEWLFHRVHGVADSVIGDIVKGVERDSEEVVRYVIWDRTTQYGTIHGVH
jgi:hypothetical protein